MENDAPPSHQTVEMDTLMPNTPSSPTSISRDLDLAKKAHKEGDVEASIAAHKIQRSSAEDNRGWQEHSAATEKHNSAVGQYIKSVVFGGVDGVITTFSVVSGTVGADLSIGIVIILGLANLFADGLSMGVGDFLSSKAELDYALNERRREMWETENYLEGEKLEMIEIYQNKGLSKEDATTIIDVMSKYKEVFVDAMLVDELGIQPPDTATKPWKNGLVTFTSFCIFGFVPLISYVISYAIWASQNFAPRQGFDPTFLIACILTGLTLFILGVVKCRFTGQNWFISGAQVFVTGGIAACCAYLIGWALEPIAKTT